MKRNSGSAGVIQRRWVGRFGIALALLFVSVITPAQAGEARGVEDAGVAEPAVPEKEAESSDGMTRILVSISSRARIRNVMERAGDFGDVIESEELAKLGIFLVEVPTENLEERMAQLWNTSGVQYVELDGRVQAADTIPNDPGFLNQYALSAIRAPQGWDYSTGSDSVTIAILDSGVDYGHEDLVGKIDEGYNFIACPPIVPPPQLPCPVLPQDDYGHGTHVAGIAAAFANNHTGIAGVSWGARIMPVKVLNSSGGGSYSGVAAGIVWAVDHGAQVINMSLGAVNDDPNAFVPPYGLRVAALYAYNNNVLLVASSGNQGSNQVLYPARYPEVVAVGASNMNNDPASFSNYGPEVELAAPGDFIYSTLPGGYGYLTGTSMSAPHVSGLAAILFSYITSADSVRGIMEATALDIGPVGWDDYSGAGLIQMDAAIAMVAPPLPTFTPTRTSTATPTMTATFTATSTPFSGGGGGGGASRPPGFQPPFFPPLPTGTSSPLPTLPLASSTQTFSPPKGSTPTPTQTPTRTSTPARDAEGSIERMKVFFSPVFCIAVLMILLGMWLFFLARRRRRKYHNKFVM